VLIPVLANDSNPDGDSLAITAVTQGASGFVPTLGPPSLALPSA